MDRSSIEKNLINLVHDFLLELDSQRVLPVISLDADLDRTLGIDSLSKIEIFHRIEKNFGIKLPEIAMTEVSTLRDLVTLIETVSLSSTTKVEYQHYTSTLEQTSVDLSTTTTLLDVITLYANKAPQRPHVYMQSEHGDEQVITYGQLYAQAQAVAAGLIKRGIQPGETIAIMLPTSAEFFYAFCGALLAGAVPVPIYPPFRPDRVEEYAKREAKILHNAQARILITFLRAETLSNILRSFVPSLIEVTTVANLQLKEAQTVDVSVQPDDTVLIQYTSGSTGDPKGVLLTNRNFLSNIHAMGKGIPVNPTDVVVSWLPLYHDMGLMNWLGSLYFGVPVTILSPLTFLTRPEQWLWTIHYHRATLSGGPNFAYELCIKRINDEDIAGLDLSSWRFAFNGAEAINPKTLESFYKKFSRYGFKAETFAPVYGLAENTVGLTLPMQIRPPRIDKILREPFERENKAITATGDRSKNILEFVCCGAVIPDHEIRIVDDKDLLLPARTVGNIQFKGPSAMQGYYNNPLATQKAFHQGWWDTGDLGYLADNELFITGRKKDLIIKAGRNLAPEEIEDTVGQITGIRKGCVIAFGINDPAIGTEKLIVVAETYESQASKQARLQEEVIEKMAIGVGVPPDTVVLVPPHTIPKTSSGKLQRSACKQAYLEGKLSRGHLPVKLQILKLAVLSGAKKAYKWLSTLGKALYTGYLGIIFILTLPLVMLSFLFVTRDLAGKIAKNWARNILRLAGCPITLQGQEHLREHIPMIFVANHASYVDSLVLVALLPPGIIFTAKKELLRVPFIGTFIKKLGYITIERLDFSESIESKKHIETALQQNQSIMIFPEGTFTYATGLRAFKLGAFIIAAETLTPICTVSIQGTRSILRGNAWLPKPGKIKVIIEKPIYPENMEWSEVMRLHSLVRAEIAKNCGEPVIDINVAGLQG